MAAGGRGEGVVGSECNEKEVSFVGVENVLELDSGNSCTILTVLKPLNCTPQRVKFVVYELYIHKAFFLINVKINVLSPFYESEGE